MTTYYIGADVHSNSTELAVEKNKKIVARYKLPTSIVSLSNVLDSLDGKKYLVFFFGLCGHTTFTNLFYPQNPRHQQRNIFKNPSLFRVFRASRG